MIVIAQAFHWFNYDAFHQEVYRVASSYATIAVCGYGLFQTQDSVFNDQIRQLYSGVPGGYWDDKRAHIENQYSTLPFPYKLLPPLEITMEYMWTATNLRGYLNSWSAVQHFKSKNGTDPVEAWMKGLGTMIESPFKVEFPLFLKLGQVIDS